MRELTAVIERCPDTLLFVGYVPDFPTHHSQGETVEELKGNLAEVIGMLLEDGEPEIRIRVCQHPHCSGSLTAPKLPVLLRRF